MPARTAAALAVMLTPALAWAQDQTGDAAQTAAQQASEAAASAAPLPDAATFTVNNTWMLVATCLVFIMHLGFATLETGLTRAKNTVNILFKNVAIVGIGLLTYALIGFNLMYPSDWWISDALGAMTFGIASPEGSATGGYNPGYTYWTDFIFQGMFAATAATIVSGAVAERIKLGPFLVFSALYVAVVYPIVGSWQWGLGFLSDINGPDAPGFHDFAGSTIVHSVGGWGALAGVIVLGPRLGKYITTPDGKTAIKPIMGHSMPLAAIGVFLLWFGWFGFNGGSVLSAEPEAVSFVFVTTSLAAAAGIFGAMATSWIVQSEPDLTMVLNGILAGLVGITAGANVVSPTEAIVIGLVAGVVVVLSVITLDRLRLDDPVGAISVHLVCGVWGTLAVGLFGTDDQGRDFSFLTQLIGVGATAALCLPAALVILYALKLTVGLRVSRTDELRGLDLSEHGMEAYSSFQFFSSQ